jgi:hypothetical protein
LTLAAAFFSNPSQNNSGGRRFVDSMTDEQNKKASRYNIFALLCGIWFVLTGWMWLYAANLIFSYPVAVLGLLFWSRARKLGSRSLLGRVALWFHIAGLVASISAIFIYK